MKKNQNGFGVVEVLIVLVVAGLIGGAAWFVMDRQKSESKVASPSTVNTGAAELSGTVSYNAAGVPSGWSQDHQDGSSIYSLVNDPLGCYVSVGVERPKQDLSNVQPQAGAPSREVALGSGQKVTLYETGQSKDYLVSEGYIVRDEFSATVTVACKDKADFSAADGALKGLNLE